MNLKNIEDVVLKVSGLHKEAVFSRSRKQELVKARQLIQYLAKCYFPEMSLESIGGLVGLNHSTVISSIRQIENLDFNFSEPFFSWKNEAQKELNKIIKPKIKTKECKYSLIFKI